MTPFLLQIILANQILEELVRAFSEGELQLNASKNQIMPNVVFAPNMNEIDD